MAKFSRLWKQFIAGIVVLFVAATASAAPTSQPATSPPIDLSKQKTLFVVGYAHLDTQWRWSYPQVIREFIPSTLRRNFALFEKYPDYIFNFSGSRRYQMMKEYYPQDYAKLKEYIAEGRWFPCGSSVDEGDCNVPSGESLVRHMLYGNQYFRREFGTESHEFMLPDCFGFTAALPSIMAHCGIHGFSTQKLTWGSAVGIPFKVGVWAGPDGQSVIAALDPGAYSGGVREDLSQNQSWLARIENTGKLSGVYTDYHYYGTGDRGGAPDAESVDWIEKSVKGVGPMHVVSSKAQDMFDDITDEQRARLPKYQGELLLTQHSAGSITSQGYMKRWNRKNELLADAAERASVAAMWLGGEAYPSKTLYDAWMLVLGSQMHDMLPGTSLPKCYEYCWSDELLALNQFADVEKSGVGAVAGAMDTRAQGVPVVVYNPLSIDREDVVEATVSFPGPAPEAVEVAGPDGNATPAQVVNRHGNQIKILFAARVPSGGFAKYDVRPAQGARPISAFHTSPNSIESERFRVTLNEAGDIASIFDKHNNREVLSAPSRLAFLYENPAQYPAWNMDWNDRKHPPRSYVDGTVRTRVVEDGPVRAALEVARESEGSTFVQTIRLAAGAAGDRVEVANRIDWQTKERSLKATFPLTASNPLATYDVQVGTLQRGNNNPKQYEVPSHQWFDLTDAKGDFGAAIVNDCKYGSDKPDDNTLRLTLLYTPGVRSKPHDQGTQDIGRHDILYAIAPHGGDWRAGNVPWIAARLNQPLSAFQVRPHDGALGSSFSLLKLNTAQVSVMALKKAEESDEVIVRLKELTGKPASDVRLIMPTGIVSAREVDGQERPIADATVRDGALSTDLGAYRLRAFALKLTAPPAKEQFAQAETISLPYDLDAVSSPEHLSDGAFDEEGRTYPADQLPPKIVSGGIEFRIGSTADEQKNALVCKGQTVRLPDGFDRVYLLASAIDGDQRGRFVIGDHPIDQSVQNWGGYIGQWDNRQWKGEVPELTYSVDNEMIGLTPGYVKRDTVAWFCSHRHHPQTGNEFYQYCYLFRYGFDLPAGVHSITLPDNDKIRVFAMTVARNTHDDAVAAHPLYDTLADHTRSGAVTIEPAGGAFSNVTRVTINHPLYWSEANLHYTLDGTEPTASSPVYSQPILLTQSAKIHAKEIDPNSAASPEASAEFAINDTTPPTVTAAAALSIEPTVNIQFSEPVRKPEAETPANYQLDPPMDVRAAKLADDGQSVTLTLAQPLDPSGARLTIHNIADLAPAANPLSTKPISVAVTGPVFVLHSIVCSGQSTERSVPNLPVKGKSAWTINLFVRANQQPENRTLIAGFGKTDDSSDGAGRYLAKFANGIHFWSRNDDVESKSPFDAGRWQMLTATYDGMTIRLYKNGKVIGQTDAELADDEPIVRIAPLDPWDNQRRFSGEIRELTIWPSALSAEALKTLGASSPSAEEQGSK